MIMAPVCSLNDTAVTTLEPTEPRWLQNASIFVAQYIKSQLLINQSAYMFQRQICEISNVTFFVNLELPIRITYIPNLQLSSIINISFMLFYYEPPCQVVYVYKREVAVANCKEKKYFGLHFHQLSS